MGTFIGRFKLVVQMKEMIHCLCYVVNDTIMLKLQTSHIHEVEEIWTANSCKSSLCNFVPKKKFGNNITFLWTQCLYHISGLRTRLLNYLRGFNDPIMIRTRSKPLQQPRQTIINLHIKRPQAVLSQWHYDTSIVLKTRTPTKPIASNLFAYKLNQLDLTNHLNNATIFWIFTPIDIVISNQQYLTISATSKVGARKSFIDHRKPWPNWETIATKIIGSIVWDIIHMGKRSRKVPSSTCFNSIIMQRKMKAWVFLH